MDVDTNTTELLMSGKYARASDNIAMESFVQTSPTCDLYLLPETFLLSGYGIALSNHSPYTSLFSDV